MDNYNFVNFGFAARFWFLKVGMPSDVTNPYIHSLHVSHIVFLNLETDSPLLLLFFHTYNAEPI